METINVQKKALKYFTGENDITYVTRNRLICISHMQTHRGLFVLNNARALLCWISSEKRNLTFSKYVDWRTIRQQPRPAFELPRRPLHEHGHNPVPANRKGVRRVEREQVNTRCDPSGESPVLLHTTVPCPHPRGTQHRTTTSRCSVVVGVQCFLP